MWWPFELITAQHRLLITLLNALLWDSKPTGPVVAVAALEPWLAGLERSDIAVCTMSQAWPFGLRSEDLAGQSIPTIVAVCRYSLVTRALCGPALSSIKMKSGSIVPSYGRTYTSKI